MKARSELVLPSNFSLGFTLASTRRLEMASPASYMPGLSPTRGSALAERAAPAGAPVGAAPVDTATPRAHAPSDSAARASVRERKGDARAMGADG
jgi:hypothetical protein